MKKTKTVHIPRLPPLPFHLPLRLPAVANHLAPCGPFALVAERIDIHQWKSKPLFQGKGSLLPNVDPTATSLRRRRNGGRQLVLRVASVEGVRSPVGNHFQAAWIGPASEILFFGPSLFHFSFSVLVFGDLIGSVCFFSECKTRGIDCEYPTKSHRGVRYGPAGSSH